MWGEENAKGPQPVSTKYARKQVKKPYKKNLFARLPYPLLQNTLFRCSHFINSLDNNNGRVTYKTTNKFGDEVIICSERHLSVSPYMDIFLATVALMQKYGFQTDEENPQRLYSTFPFPELCAVIGAKKGFGFIKQNLPEHLKALGRTSFTVNYAEDSNDATRCVEGTSFSIPFFWDVEIISRKGKLGNIVKIFPSEHFIPKKDYFKLDALLCNSLKRDASKAIFWHLIGRQHLKATVQDWYALLGSRASCIYRWKSDCFLPALKELAEFGYTIKKAQKNLYIINK